MQYFNPLLQHPNIGTRTPFQEALNRKKSPWEDLTMQREKEIEAEEESDSFLDNLRTLQNRGQGPVQSEYSRFLAQDVPQRENYQRSKGAKIAAALLSGLGTYTGDRNAVERNQQALDRPYNEAVEQYGMQGKVLNEAAEREESHYQNELTAASALARYGIESNREKRQEERQDNQFKMQMEMESGRNTRADANLTSLEERREAQDSAALVRTIQADKDRAAERALDRSAAAANTQAIIAGQNLRDRTSNPAAEKTPSYSDESKARSDARNILINTPEWSWLRDNVEIDPSTGAMSPKKAGWGEGTAERDKRAGHIARFEQAAQAKAQELLGKGKTSQSAAQPKYIMDKDGNYVLNPNYGK